jgi:hypothetical protein
MPLNTRSGTLTIDTVTSVALTDVWPEGVWVHNRHQTGEIWVRLDGTDPTVGGDDCYIVQGSRFFPASEIAREDVTVKLISSAALNYAVEGAVKWQ